MSDTQQEAADWASWLDQWERDIWPVFCQRGITKDTAALIYFTRFPENVPTEDDPEFS